MVKDTLQTTADASSNRAKAAATGLGAEDRSVARGSSAEHPAESETYLAPEGTRRGNIRFRCGISFSQAGLIGIRRRRHHSTAIFSKLHWL
jgi:hypothetical protein